MSSRLSHFTCRVIALAVVTVSLLSLGGCRMMQFHKDFWNMDNWSLDKYRDERAVDIDHRLEQSDTGVKNPFK